MALIIDLSRQDDAVQARVLADQAVAIVRQYGPRAVLQATADTLTYYLADLQPDEAAGSPHAYQATADAIQACRHAARTIDRETLQRIART